MNREICEMSMSSIARNKCIHTSKLLAPRTRTQNRKQDFVEETKTRIVEQKHRTLNRIGNKNTNRNRNWKTVGKLRNSSMNAPKSPLELNENRATNQYPTSPQILVDFSSIFTTNKFHYSQHCPTSEKFH